MLRVRRHLLTVLALLAALSVSPLAAGDNTPGRPGTKPAGGDRTKKDHAEPLKVKAFQLKRTNPEEVRQTLLQLWPHLNPAAGEEGNAGTPRQPGLGVAGGQPMPRLAVSQRSRTLFVRAGKTALETAGELIEVLDGDSEKASGDLKNLSIIRLRHANVNEILQVLQPLGLQGTFVALPQMNAIVVLKAGDNAQEIEEVISQADRPAPSDRTSRGDTTKPKR